VGPVYESTYAVVKPPWKC